MTRSILVTGGAGYIGSHVCKALSQAGYRPIVLDNLCLGHESFVKWGPLVVGDIQDSELITRTIREHSIEAVMHFSAFAYVGESVSDPQKYYVNNVAGMLGLLAGMRAAECTKIVFSSTCAVYGEPNARTINEDTLAQPVNPYGRSKLMCEAILRDYSAAYGLDYIALRYFNASGDDPDGEVGEDRLVETHLIPRALMALLGHIDDFQVFGCDFPTPDGTAIRDYIHVVDLARAHVLALKRLLAATGKISILNLGAGKGHSVKEVLDVIAAVTGHSFIAPRGNRRQGDPAELVADNSLAAREIGFVPAHSDLRNIIETAWSWHQRRHPVTIERRIEPTVQAKIA